MATQKEKQKLIEIFDQIGELSSVLNTDNSLGETQTERDKTSLCAALAVKGKMYSEGLMVIGRVSYGWSLNGHKPEDFNNPEVSKAFAENIYVSATEPEKVWKYLENTNQCPLCWVQEEWDKIKDGSNGKGIGKRNFWQVIRSLVDELGIADTSNDNQIHWSSYIVWSNLFKVLPFLYDVETTKYTSWNPTGELRNVQMRGCQELLKLELEAYIPSQIVFITEQNTNKKANYDVRGEWSARDFLNSDVFLESGLTYHEHKKLRNKGFVAEAGYLKLGNSYASIVLASRPDAWGLTSEELKKWSKDVVFALNKLSVAKEKTAVLSSSLVAEDESADSFPSNLKVHDQVTHNLRKDLKGVGIITEIFPDGKITVEFRDAAQKPVHTDKSYVVFTGISPQSVTLV